MRILVADSRAQVRSALRLLLEHQPDMSVVGEASDAAGLLAQAAACGADLVLLDWELPGLGVAGDAIAPGKDLDHRPVIAGILAEGSQSVALSCSGYELLRALRDHCPGVRTIVLSGNAVARPAAVVAGADGFVSKGDPPDLLLAEIAMVCQGGESCTSL